MRTSLVSLVVLILIGSGALGNAATRLEAWVAPGGTYVHGSYPDIEDLWRERSRVWA
jgi:hypothetical protein